MGLIQKMYPLHFSNFRIRYTQTSVEDVISEVQQSEIIIEAHIRAHRGIDENRLQILEKYYFPSMTKKIRSKINLCQTCKVNKYDRHPNKTDLQETPIPTFPGHTIHIDIYITNKHHILTAIDKFSKYALAKLINSRSMEDIRKPLRDMLFYFGVPKSVIMDNEKSFNSASILFFLHPPYTSGSNGQVERFHSTFTEIMRCLKAQDPSINFEELVEKAVTEYNHSIHSTIKKNRLMYFLEETLALPRKIMKRQDLAISRSSNQNKTKT